MKKTALITGGTQGIGLGIASRLGRDGYQLAIASRSSQEKVRPALERLTGLPVRETLLYSVQTGQSISAEEKG